MNLWLPRGRVGGWIDWEFRIDMHTLQPNSLPFQPPGKPIFKTDNQKGPTVKKKKKERKKKLEINGNFLILTMDIYEKPTANILINCKRLKAYHTRPGTA